MKLVLEGRASCRELLNTYYLSRRGKLLPENQKALKDQFDRFLSLFVSEEGQTAFLVGQSKMLAQDYATALPQFEQADSLEAGNIRVLRMRARAERQLKRFDAFHKTVSRLYESNPLEESLWEEYLESLFYQRELESVVMRVKSRGEEQTGPRARTALALSLAETKRETEALAILQALTSRDRVSPVHPRVWYAQGKIFAGKGGYVAEAIASLERFVDLATQPKHSEIEGWDPYHTDEAVEPARKLLNDLKTRISKRT